MSAARVASLSGPEAMRAAEKLRKQQERLASWPYPHLFPPPDSIPVNQIGAAVACPAPGVSVTLLTYQVSVGFRFFLTAILQSFDASMNAGDAQWTVSVSNLRTGGATSQLVQGLAATIIPLGDWRYGTRWQFDRAYEFGAQEQVTSAVANLVLGAGSGNFVSGFFGFLVPVGGKAASRHV